MGWKARRAESFQGEDHLRRIIEDAQALIAKTLAAVPHERLEGRMHDDRTGHSLQKQRFLLAEVRPIPNWSFPSTPVSMSSCRSSPSADGIASLTPCRLLHTISQSLAPK
jgi:hypothetical protein